MLYAGDIHCSCGKSLPPERGSYARCRCGLDVDVYRFRPIDAIVRAEPFSAEAGAPCAYHQGNQAVAACARCGSFICHICQTPVEGEDYCPGCFSRKTSDESEDAFRTRYPRPHSLSSTCAAVSLLIPICAVVTAPMAVFFGIRAIRQRKELLKREAYILPSAIAGLLVGALYITAVVVLIISAVT